MEDENEQGVTIRRALHQLLKNLEGACLIEFSKQSILRTHNIDSLLDLSDKERLSAVLLPRVSSLTQIRTEKKFEGRVARVASIANGAEIGVITTKQGEYFIQEERPLHCGLHLFS